jgi:chaperone required for assembly of F1-ATPase
MVKRFYKTVGVAPGKEGGFRVLLDGRELRSPEKRTLDLPTEPLAEAIAAEWDAQVERVDAHAMPLMSLASTAVDRIGPMRDQIVGEILRFAETDLLCYRADTPDALIRRQEQLWQPLLDWAAMRYDARLKVQTGIVPVMQPPESIAALRLAVEAMDDAALAAASAVTAITGSVVIALALVEQRIGPEEATAASQLDERFQAEFWGEDPEAARRRTSQAVEIDAADRFVRLTRGEGGRPEAAAST